MPTGTVVSKDSIRAIKWDKNHLVLLDQRGLPTKIEYLKLHTADQVAGAIRDMVVRGAPAIGIAAAYGFVFALSEALHDHTESWHQVLNEKVMILKAARPTAINLVWALDRMQGILQQTHEDPVKAVLTEAHAIYNEDVESNHIMGDTGASYLDKSCGVLTHCNTGSLATGGYGTALGVIRSAYARYGLQNIYVSETRPWLQGSRLTAWELIQENIPATVITDSAAASLMQQGKINWVITGADRIAANGDVANKIGTYSHAVNARYHDVGFMVVAPSSSIDINTSTGEEINIEERHGEEISQFSGQQIAPSQVDIYNPVFDITPHHLISVIVTELGGIEHPDASKIQLLLEGKKT
jgi:methylthioribose-1-phosphate isomerase